ncbi:MAG: nuclear transport factor 2 family protein [Polaribacter sp.]
MKSTSILSMAIVLLIAIYSCNSQKKPSSINNQKTNKMVNKTAKEKAVALLESLPTKNTLAVVEYVSDEKYIQHNPNVPDGKKVFEGFVKQGLISKAKVVRVFQDENYVVAHMDYDFMGNQIAFDVIRFENGKAVEHWDNLVKKSDKPSPSGHTQIDGTTEIKDFDKTEENKTLIKDFVNTILIGQNYDQSSRFFDGDNYIQHNTQVPDGVSGFGQALKAMADQGIYMVYEKTHKILGQGNFVLTMSEGTFGGKPTAFFDLFRVENGKIAEHWDVIETIPAKDLWKNNNGKF